MRPPSRSLVRWLPLLSATLLVAGCSVSFSIGSGATPSPSPTRGTSTAIGRTASATSTPTASSSPVVAALPTMPVAVPPSLDTLPFCAPGTHAAPGYSCAEGPATSFPVFSASEVRYQDCMPTGPTACWVTSLDPGLVQEMPAATAQLAAEASPPASDLYAAPADPEGAVWAQAECNWAMDTMYYDQQADSALSDDPGVAESSRAGYAQWAQDWSIVLQQVDAQCTGPNSAQPSSTATTAALAWFDQAGEIAAGWYTVNGPSDTWDQEWADSYMALIGTYGGILF